MDFPDTDPNLYLDLGRDQLAYQLNAADAIEAKTGTWGGRDRDPPTPPPANALRGPP